jgi:hypothetical protein
VEEAVKPSQARRSASQPNSGSGDQVGNVRVVSRAEAIGSEIMTSHTYMPPACYVLALSFPLSPLALPRLPGLAMEEVVTG